MEYSLADGWALFFLFLEKGFQLWLRALPSLKSFFRGRYMGAYK